MVRKGAATNASCSQGLIFGSLYNWPYTKSDNDAYHRIQDYKGSCKLMLRYIRMNMTLSTLRGRAVQNEMLVH